MTETFDYFDDGELEPLEITRQQIDDCDSVETLLEWLDGLTVLKGNVEADFGARTFTGTATPEWIHRVSQKLAFLSMGQNRCERRLRILGHEPRPLGRKIDELNRKIVFMKAEALYAKAFIDTAARLLVPDQFEEIREAALRSLPKKLDEAA